MKYINDVSIEKKSKSPDWMQCSLNTTTLIKMGRKSEEPHSAIFKKNI
jgi:hypothetical protein